MDQIIKFINNLSKFHRSTLGFITLIEPAGMSVAQLVGQMAPIMVIIGWICTAIIFCLTVVYWRWTIKNAVLQNKVLKDVIKGSQGTDITESKK